MTYDSLIGDEYASSALKG